MVFARFRRWREERRVKRENRILKLLEVVMKNDLEDKEAKFEVCQEHAGKIKTEFISTNFISLEEFHGFEIEVVREIDAERKNIAKGRKLDRGIRDDIITRLTDLHNQEGKILETLIKQFDSMLPVNTDMEGKPIYKQDRINFTVALEDYKKFCDKAHVRRLELVRLL